MKLIQVVRRYGPVGGMEQLPHKESPLPKQKPSFLPHLNIAIDMFELR